MSPVSAANRNEPSTAGRSKRAKAPSQKFRDRYGHTPLSAAEDILWRLRQLVIGTGADGPLPVVQEVRDEARRRKVDLVVLPTAEAIGALNNAAAGTNAILHLTCWTGRRQFTPSHGE